MIEDISSGCPDWETAGAQLVSDVERHELMKLRCLTARIQRLPISAIWPT